MLQALHIENIAVIRSLDIDFEHGFSVLSGETGAGKSIIIDSIHMLSGSRISRELIRNGQDKATVSAVFSDCDSSVGALLENYGLEFDGSIIITRSLTRDGKSSVKINGRTVTQALQKELCRLLINIHGQYDNQKLMQKASQIEILDAYAENQELLTRYNDLYHRYQKLCEDIRASELDEAQRNRMQDILKFQLDEISKANLRSEDEEEVLEVERRRLGSIEKITEAAGLSYRMLYASDKGVVSVLDRVISALSKISDVLPEAGECVEQLTNFRYEIQDIADRIQEISLCDQNPTEKLDRIEGRLNTITRLKKKYGATVGDILSFRDQIEAQLSDLENSDVRREEMAQELSRLQAQARAVAEQIHQKREAAAHDIVERVRETLCFLDMPKMRFEIKLSPVDKLKSNGCDEVEFLISANVGEPPQPLEKIASGGELSRIMLALKSVLSDKDGVGTVVFDEVDAGISGKTSRKVGIKLKQISGNTQVICVTHSAQIASLADYHFLISKHDVDGRTETRVEPLTEEGRVGEVARILGGIRVTESQLAVAKEMIEDGKRYQ